MTVSWVLAQGDLLVKDFSGNEVDRMSLTVTCLHVPAVLALTTRAGYLPFSIVDSVGTSAL